MIQVENLTKRFVVGDRQFDAVQRLSFRVGPGEVFGLLGPNGAGKTTTLRMILGLMPPTEGTAVVQGFDVRTNPNDVKRRIGYASATVGVYPWLTPYEMLLFAADLYSIPLPLAKQRVETLADLLSLRPFLRQRCATLSTGQRQRINLARALMHDPPVMLMDEPTLGLDIVGSRVVFEYIDHLRQNRKAVIVCTHRLDEAQRLCDRFGLLHHGRMMHHGTLEELQARTGKCDLTDMFLDLLDSDPDANAQPVIAE